jgi:hypothetical protein
MYILYKIGERLHKACFCLSFYAIHYKETAVILYIYFVLEININDSYKPTCVPLKPSIYRPDENFRVRVMVLNAIFNNISVISWLAVLLVEETGVP